MKLEGFPFMILTSHYLLPICTSRRPDRQDFETDLGVIMRSLTAGARREIPPTPSHCIERRLELPFGMSIAT
jgi:hypothetical protein